MNDRLNRAATMLNIAILLLAIPLFPLPYGGVLPGGKLLIQLFAFLAALIAALTGPGDAGHPDHVSGRLPRARAAAGPLLLLVGVALLGLVQLIPTGAALLSRISTTSAEVYAAAGNTLAQFDRPAPEPRISIAPTDTVVTLLLTLAYGALFFAAARAFTTRPRRRWFLGVLVLTALGQTFHASLTNLTDRASGSFVNPNHLAGYLEIALAATFGLILWASLVGSDRAQMVKDPIERLSKRWTPVAWAVVVWAVVAIGIAITRSRGGIMMAAVTTLVMLTMAVMHGRSRFRRAIAVGESLALLAGLAIVALTTGTYPLLRFLTSDPRDAESDMRVQLWRLSIEAWKKFPVFGSGLGSYREAFRRIQPEGMNALVEQAHNDGLQLLVTGGLVGFILAATALIWLLVLFARAFFRQRHREESAWAIAGFGALLSLLLHGLVEFNFSIPAIPATLSLMLGCAWAAATREE